MTGMSNEELCGVSNQYVADVLVQGFVQTNRLAGELVWTVCRPCDEEMSLGAFAYGAFVPKEGIL